MDVITKTDKEGISYVNSMQDNEEFVENTNMFANCLSGLYRLLVLTIHTIKNHPRKIDVDNYTQDALNAHSRGGPDLVSRAFVFLSDENDDDEHYWRLLAPIVNTLTRAVTIYLRKGTDNERILLFNDFVKRCACLIISQPTIIKMLYIKDLLKYLRFFNYENVEADTLTLHEMRKRKYRDKPPYNQVEIVAELRRLCTETDGVVVETRSKSHGKSQKKRASNSALNSASHSSTNSAAHSSTNSAAHSASNHLDRFTTRQVERRASMSPVYSSPYRSKPASKRRNTFFGKKSKTHRKKKTSFFGLF